MNFDNFEKKILDKISMIAGIYGFSHLNADEFSVYSGPLEKKLWYNAINKIQQNNEVIINLAIIILQTVNAKTIVKEIATVVKYYAKKNNFKISVLNIHIKGVN
ncbi:hypothetical protein [[Mycoplasma] collis]|uniref:hypothetical protein n=1 Tax=[Mycoplasma] collis TaxID=2127 RepID=UPI00051B9E80|nr:hypothetical protein [[Mycoplasma] collis]